MEVNILDEHGYALALRGMSYSFKRRELDVEPWWKEQYPRAEKRAPKLAQMEGGHNKFLESIVVWIDVEAPRYWWSEMDTYRVGTTKQSESTMHTLSKREMSIDDCAFTDFTKDGIELQVNLFNRHREEATINEMKQMVPEAYLQRRLICTNYKVIKNIIQQRHNHRLPEWQVFCEAMRSQLKHVEFL